MWKPSPLPCSVIASMIVFKMIQQSAAWSPTIFLAAGLRRTVIRRGRLSSASMVVGPCYSRNAQADVLAANRPKALSACDPPSADVGSGDEMTANERGDPASDTIFALSSGYSAKQATALAVIRVSGSQARRVLRSLTDQRLKLPTARKAVLRKLTHDGHTLDSALVLLFEQPQSFTGEDLVEFHCHGSRAVIQGMLDVLPSLGCRLAEPGEFTQRAFGNGKLDLVQVEGLADILASETKVQLRQALRQLDGELSRVYDSWRQQLVSGLAHAEAVIDFGDDERLGDDDILDDDSAQWDVWGEVSNKMKILVNSMEEHLSDDRKGELIRDGINIAILGPPNAGKSSLFNLIARRDAAIVSPVAGTTRDVLRVDLDLGGIKCTLQDTAGVRSATSDVLEIEGMKRAKAAVENADIVVAVVDGTDINAGIHTILRTTSESNLQVSSITLLINKIDLLEADGMARNDHDISSMPTISEFESYKEISCTTQAGVDDFLHHLTQRASLLIQNGENGAESGLITRTRHREHVENAVQALRRFDVLSNEGTMAVDMAAEELRLAASELGRITGAVDVEDVLDVLFSDFCIGK
mmetsp:Transcript_23785/g.67247  ORF Transcript_23785/g.67247 Transcript_23785/m.67247 type:complete len:584 (-) Transcript_23785:1661-3412(-)